ncbi:SpoIIE family protein phosphatase [candidate division KSB1 bacterium]|nr:SpoIIE family protein phosphatase [candidate division KSB1 bacterium]
MFKAVNKDEIKVPGHIDYLGELRNFVTKTGKKYKFPDSVINAFKLSIDEAATNIIKHAYRDEDGDITMRIVVRKNSMTVVLLDQGKYFDPAKAKDPDLKRYVDIGKKGGLGIFIMRRLMDEIDYRHTEEGNELRLTKFRDGDFRKKELPKSEEKVSKVPSSAISLSLKSNYSLISAAILTAIIAIGYLYFYIVKGQQVTDEILAFEKSNSVNIANSVVKPGEYTLSTLYIGTHLIDAIDLEERSEIYKVIIIDSDNLCQYSTDDELTFTEFRLPPNIKEIHQGIYQYETDDGIEVYDIVSPIYAENNEKIGENHLLIKKEYVDTRVSNERLEYLKLAVLILLMGYVGIAILIYIVMNPFRKLSEWVKQLGHGDVEDEYDFDTGSELGEIAKAFSEITDKFKKSQANLAEQERLQKEMQLAQDIQQTLLPTRVPQLEGYEISSFYEAAKEVGGDYYDFVEVDKDSLGIVVADVSGKGVPGSLIMTMIRTALRTEARGVKSASEVLARLNNFVVKDMKKGMFVTIFYVIIDSKKRRLNYASAGHNPMILYRQTTNKTYYLNPKGFPVGISLPDPELFKKSIESDTIQLAEDDVLLIYTDGITEAMNHKRTLFGEERLLDAIRKHATLRVEPFSEKLKNDIYSFTQGFEQNDDITLVAIKEKSSPEKIEYQRAQKAHNLILNGKNIREACEDAGITTYAYYNKYKKIFEEEGVEAYSIDDTISLESKHFSIEEKTKIYDIIKKHPEYGAKRISEELNSEQYGFTKINESRIYDELVRSRLNTRQLREAYVARSGKKKRMKPPGTPMLTLDGRIILDRKQYETEEETFEEPEEKVVPEEKSEKQVTEKSEPEEKAPEKPKEPQKELDDDFMIENLISTPIENLLEKRREKQYQDTETDDVKQPEKKEEQEKESVEDDEEIFDETEKEEKPEEIEASGESSEVDDSFVDMFEEGSEEDVEIDEQNANENEDKDSDLITEERGIISYADSEVEEEKEQSTAATSDDRETDELNDDDAELAADIDLLDIDDNFDVEDGIEHDFSFKDMWEGAQDANEGKQTENPEDDDSSKEEEETDDSEQDEPQADELDINKRQEDSHLSDEEKEDFEISEVEIQNDFDDNSSLFTDNAQFTFTDLVAEVNEHVSYYDSDIEEQPVTSESHDSDNDEDLQTDDDERENRIRLDKMLKEKHLILGLKYYRDNKFNEAIEEFKQVLEMYPDFKEVHSILGNAYFRNDMSELAMNEYQQVIQIDPYDVDAYENIGVIYANWGEYSKAIGEWEKLLEIDNSRSDIRKNVEKAKNILQSVDEKE